MQNRELPEYYKSIEFVDRYSRKHLGYLEPPFGMDGVPMFAESGSADVAQGFGGIFYDVEDIVFWKYVDNE